MKLLLTRALQDGTKRGYLSPAAKQRVWAAHAGLCMWCLAAVPAEGPQVDYDHRVPLAINGADDEANLAPIHRRPCHKEKTRQDKGRIAKAKRQRRLIEPRREPKRPLFGRGFDKLLTRGFDGKTRRKP